MRGKGTTRQADIDRLWSRWLDVVANLSENSQRAKRLPQKKYGQLHSSLMHVIDAALQDESSQKRREVLRQMQLSCKPWVSLSAFSQAEKHIVTNLLQNSRELQFQLTGRRKLGKKTAIRFRRWSLLVGVSLITIVLWGIPFAMSGDGMLRTRAFWYRNLYFLQQISPYDLLPIVMVIMILVGIWALRSTKQY